MRGRLWGQGLDPYTLDPTALLDVAWAFIVDGIAYDSTRDTIIDRLAELFDEPPVWTEETWGTSAADQRAAAKMYELAGGPAPLRKQSKPD